MLALKIIYIFLGTCAFLSASLVWEYGQMRDWDQVFHWKQLKCWIKWKHCLGLPWECSGWESACQSRRHGFEPWSGKIPHASEQLSPCATTTESACHNYWSPCTWSPCSATREATAVRSPRTATKRSPRSPQLEKAHTQQRRPNAAKNK